jgi:hypothetical protein
MARLKRQKEGLWIVKDTDWTMDPKELGQAFGRMTVMLLFPKNRPEMRVSGVKVPGRILSMRFVPRFLRLL